MRYLLITIISILGFNRVIAQQTPIYSQNYLNFYLINPAAIGSSNETRFMLHHRQQWVGLQDAPRTSGITFETPIKENKYAIGLKLNTDQIHLFNTTSGEFSLRYKLPITEDHLLSFGLAGIFIQKKIDFSKIRVEDQSEASLLDYNSSQMSFDADFGLFYQWQKLKAGLSVNQLLNSGFKYENDIDQKSATYKNIRHFNLFVSYDFHINKKPIDITPTFFARHVQGAGVSMEINTVVKWKEKFWGGLGYRQNSGIIFLAGAQVLDRLIVGYSYDLSPRGMRTYNKGSHEIAMGYRISSVTKSSKSNAQISRAIRNQEEDISDLKKENEELNKQLKEQKKEIQNQKKEVNTLKKTYETEKPEMDKVIEDNQVNSPNSKDDPKRDLSLSEADNTKINELEKQIEELKKLIEEDSKNNSSASSNDLDEIRKEIDQLKKDQDLTSANTKESKETDQKSTKEDVQFYVVAGAYFKIEDAKAYQRMLKRESGIETKVVSREDRKFFFVYTKSFDNLKAARQEIEKLKTGTLKDTINGNFWVYAKK